MCLSASQAVECASQPPKHLPIFRQLSGERVRMASVRYAPEDPTLPKPWRGLVDGSTGNLYFWNPVTNVTQYEKPKAPSDVSAPPAPPLKSSVEVDRWADKQPTGASNCDNGENVGSKFNNGGRSVGSSAEVDYSSPEKQQRPSGYSGGDMRSDSEQKFVANSGGQTQQAFSSGGGHLNDVSANVSQNGSDILNHENGAQNMKSYSTVTTNSDNAQSAESYRRQHEITVIGNNVPPPFTSFESTGFPPELLRSVRMAGFGAPTPIQAQSWPIAMKNNDIVAVAKTGSGKTLGYLLPGFIHLKRCGKNPKMGPTVLVLSPTRELATQIQDEAEKFGSSSGISCTCLYGGAQKGPQIRDIEKGVDIVVATPGRLNDILEMGKISLSQVSYLVLDEADRMLDMGFEPQIRKIMKELPTRRQTLMYTATWPKSVRNIAAELLTNPVQVNIGRTDELVANKSIAQHVEVVPYQQKNKRLEQIVQAQEPRSKIIIFCSTKRMCDQLVQYIPRSLGAAAIHGDKSQGERDYVLGQFRNGSAPILVATDVAARGLDVKDIRVVINYDFPTGIEDYVHRIGRTGRGGATGMAYTFFTDKDAKHASDLVKILEGANQQVPQELRDLMGRGGFGGFNRDRPQWGSGGGRGGGGRDQQNVSSFGGRGGGRGFERNRSRSPPKW